MMRVKYIGSHDAVEVAGLVVAKDEVVEFDNEFALSLLDQPSNWERVYPEGRSKKSAD